MNSENESTVAERINFRTAQFVKSAQTLGQCPDDTGAEVAFAGRSNAGKSSAINRLTGQKKLARTSKTPGRTQLMNFFSVSEEQRLVDLPGYGYAKVPDKIKREWEKNLTEYLNERESLQGCVLLMDVRHPLREFDQNFIGWSLASELPVHVLLTKCDKLKRGPAKSTLLSVVREVKSTFGTDSDTQQAGFDQLFSAQLFSSLKGDGLDTLEQKISSWIAHSKE